MNPNNLKVRTMSNDASTCYSLQDINDFCLNLIVQIKALHKTLATADDIQWQPSPVPGAEFAAKQQGPSDPTVRQALDERRLAVRAGIKESVRNLKIAAERLSACNAHLNEAIDSWEG